MTEDEKYKNVQGRPKKLSAAERRAEDWAKVRVMNRRQRDWMLGTYVGEPHISIYSPHATGNWRHYQQSGQRARKVSPDY